MKQRNFKPKTAFLLLIVGIFSIVSCSYAGDKTPSIVKSFSIDTPGSLEVKTSGGWIEVEGVPGNKVAIYAYVKKKGVLLSPSDPLVKDLYKGYNLEMSQSGNHITVIAKREQNVLPWKQLSISFKLEVPNDMACDLNTSGGGLKLANVNGLQQLHTSGGGIKLTNIVGNTSANTSGGGIRVEDIKGKSELNTSGGGIHITKAYGDIKAHTSGGPIELDDIYGNIEAHTSGGGIRITGEAAYVRASTSGGGIRVDVTGVQKELHLETSGGGIHANIPLGLGMDLDLSGNAVNMEFMNFSGYQKKNKVKGSMNGGGIPVYMHTSGGSVNVNFN